MLPSPHPSSPPVALTVAGSDNSAGAGIQADLKTFAAHGVYGLTAVTCVVAEVPGRVAAIQAVDLAVVRQQIELSLAHYPVAAVKTGLLYSAEVVTLVADLLGSLPSPLVVDPVMVASSGDSLLRREALAAYQEHLFPRATLVTPNLDEAAVLLGHRLYTVDDMRAGGRELCARYNVAFLMKGGHLGGTEAVDVLCLPDGTSEEHRAPFTRGVATHGTGCTYSAAITAALAGGHPLTGAVALAKTFITAAVARSFRWQQGHQTVEALNVMLPAGVPPE